MEPEQNLTPGYQIPPDGAPNPPPVAVEPPPKGGRHFNLPIFLAAVLLVLTIAMGVVAIYYILKYNEQKSTVDQQKTAAAQTAREEQKQADEAAYAERDKLPYRSYEAPAVLGAIKIEFPKIWNVYAVEEEKSDTQLDIFMYPGVVRAEKSSTEAYALRVKLQRKLYQDVVKANQQKVEKGELKASAVTISGATGTRYEGEVVQGRSGSLILLPVRDKTLSIWTESPDYLNDYNQIIEKLAISP